MTFLVVSLVSLGGNANFTGYPEFPPAASPSCRAGFCQPETALENLGMPAPTPTPLL